MMTQLYRTHPLRSACLSAAALLCSASAAAQDVAPDPLATGDLIQQERNFATLNTANFDPNRIYDVPEAGPDAAQFRFKLKGYVFGLRMVRANYTGWYDDTRYAAYADIKTSGLGALLKKMEIWAITRGAWTPKGLRPDYHVQQNMDKKNRRVEMNYDNALSQVDVAIVPPLGSQGIPAATPAERFAANDTLSAIMTMMMRGAKTEGRACEGSVPVFDSKQHYNLRMERVEEMRYKYDGEKLDALKCHIYYEPVSGFDPEDLPDSEEESTPITVYFTKMDDLGLYVPLKFTYKISSIKAVIKVDEMVIVPAEKS
ncbi:DUF3108 domain-containing protein [Litorimonas sp. RW-G-Af-16]|uniref:DUF3108 domain-containing protein n=1 Tax=Litorimonas sp. RW-G-Af-16 TaxID=3241168 RepID=UPI00390CB883